MSLDDYCHLCVVKKVLNKSNAYEYYKINEPDNVLTECYYICDGYKLICELMNPNDKYESKF